MTEKKRVAENRRKLLKTVAAGGGAIIAGKSLPENWTRPAVDSVMLPAHALTSGGPYSGTLVATLDSDSMLARAVDGLVSPAYADPPPEPIYEVSWCITTVSETAADVQFLVTLSYGSGICSAELCSASNVPVGVRTNLPCVDACVSESDAGEWLDELGLVRAAKASASATSYVTLSGVRPGNSFRFEDTGKSIDKSDTLQAGDCGPTSVICGGACSG